MEDNKIIKRCQNGDKEAFQEIISKYHPYVFKFLIRITGHKELSEDLTQDTFVKLIRNIDKFDIQGSAKFSTYVITITKNCYIDYLRKEKNYNSNVLLDEKIKLYDGNNLEEIVIDNIENEYIKSKLDTLQEEQRVVIKMKYLEMMTLKEIGEALQIEPKTVKSRIHNGITKLRKILGGGDNELHENK